MLNHTGRPLLHEDGSDGMYIYYDDSEIHAISGRPNVSEVVGRSREYKGLDDKTDEEDE